MTDIDKSKVIDFRRTTFVTSAPDISKLPNDVGAEIAIIGRSNSGKSSSINAICDQKTLAKTSRTPGRTRLINLFKVNEGKYLVDLPGYGYAQVPEQMKRQWQKAMTDYLQQRKCLCGLVVTMDIRTPLRDHDRMIIDWSIAANLPCLILLTKADKLCLEYPVSIALDNSSVSITVLLNSPKLYFFIALEINEISNLAL